ncbi:MAG: GatB/YqeY domain-containing protein [Gammaproteobacteria bacterium]|jgi:uncharacterized protein YqeY
MSNLKLQISDDIKSAMRNREKERLITLRMITAAIKQKEVDERIELDDSHVLAIIDKLARQHKDSIQQFEDAGRNDLVEKEKSELLIVQTYLPEQLSDEDVSKIVNTAIKTASAESIKDMGKVMGILKPELQGRTDMSNVSKIVKTLLS